MASSHRFEFRFVTRANSIECWMAEMSYFPWLVLRLLVVAVICAFATAPAVAFGDTVTFRKCDPAKVSPVFSGSPPNIPEHNLVVHATVVRTLRRSSEAAKPTDPNESLLGIIKVDEVSGPQADKVPVPSFLILSSSSCNLPFHVGDRGFVSGLFRAETRDGRFPGVERFNFILRTSDPSQFLPK